MSPRILRVLLPVLALVVALFGLYQLFVAGLSVRLRNYPMAMLYAAMGFAGLAISSAMWRTAKRFR